ncbi:FAM49 family protein [Mucor ambiguus]|uniref:FAM49 family protein n=1 Tax=Mucor ambiguus TaxID=91626 RepID=A0A0C9MZJ5_9FUNG|nr:FAM49 family protein [Mucor ambiguus]
MGQLISGLSLRPGDALVPELGFDLENATPSSDELQLYNKLLSLLVKPGPALLHLLKSYVPASDQIRDAIAKPTPENESRAWDAVSPTVDILRDIYDYSADLQEGLPKLLSVLCQGDVSKNLEKNQGLAKLFAELLDFVFEFDHLKMRSPTLQNDFSYYRRMLQRGRYGSQDRRDGDDNSISDLRSAMIEDDQANRISLFIAYPTPMLKCIIDTTTKFVNNNRLQKSVGDWLAALWATCFNTVSKKRNQNPEISAFCMKVMVVSIILYDHIDPNGAFYKNSPINIKHSVKIIQTITTVKSNEYSATNLLSALRYNSKHLNDDTTPKNVKNLVLAT